MSLFQLVQSHGWPGKAGHHPLNLLGCATTWTHPMHVLKCRQAEFQDALDTVALQD